MSIRLKSFVSIIIPVFNGSDYLAQAIDSAIAQTYPNIEILVINDGSTDNGETERIALSYGNKIRYFTKPNGGVASALNLGIREMRGDYFSWLSHDDVYLPHKIEAQIDFINKFELNDCIVYSDYACINAKGQHTHDVHMPSVAPEAMFQHLYCNQSIHGCSLLIPREIFVEVGTFPEYLPTTQDYELWLAMCRKRLFIRQAEILIQARQHCDQGSRRIKNHLNAIREFYIRHLPEAYSYCDTWPKQCSLLTDALQNRISAGLYSVAWYTLVWVWQKTDNSSQKIQVIKILTRQLLKVAYLKFPRFLRKISKSIYNTIASYKADIQRLDFHNIYNNEGFRGTESLSGAGSTLFLTRIIRRELPLLFSRLNIKSIVDVPCGDFHWMQHVNLTGIDYTGGDVVSPLAESNQYKYGSNSRSFQHIDLLAGPIPKRDLVFCRDCLVHLPLNDIKAAITNIKHSGSKWLLTTTFTETNINIELKGLNWRPINLTLPPFNFPPPTELINEKCTEAGGLFGDKCLGLWPIDNLPD